MEPGKKTDLYPKGSNVVSGSATRLCYNSLSIQHMEGKNGYQCSQDRLGFPNPATAGLRTRFHPQRKYLDLMSTKTLEPFWDDRFVIDVVWNLPAEGDHHRAVCRGDPLFQAVVQVGGRHMG